MLKKFWEWIRRLFAAPPEKTDQALSTEKRRAWFEQCEPGFLVWARMPLPEEELAKVEPAHQIRPYLILAKTETELTCEGLFVPVRIPAPGISDGDAGQGSSADETNLYRLKA